MTDLDVLEGLLNDVVREGDKWEASGTSVQWVGAGTIFTSFRGNATTDAAELVATAVNALPDLISAARERDAMREYYEARIEVDYQLGTLAGVKRAARNRLLKAQALIEARQSLNPSEAKG